MRERPGIRIMRDGEERRRRVKRGPARYCIGVKYDAVCRSQGIWMFVDVEHWIDEIEQVRDSEWHHCRYDHETVEVCEPEAEALPAPSWWRRLLFGRAWVPEAKVVQK